MRAGTVVELKPGLFGLEAPKNLGVYLDRRKRKKEFLLVVVTIKGAKEVRREQVTKRRFQVELDAGAPEGDLVKRLKALVAERAEGKLTEETEEEGGEKEWSERRVWEKTNVAVTEPVRPEELARLVVGGEPSKADVRRVEKVLERCRRPGMGFFERHVKGTWLPIRRGQMQAFQRIMTENHTLRKRLVQLRVEEDATGEESESLVGVYPDEAGLSDGERETLNAWGEALGLYVLYDGWRDDVVPPGCPVHSLLGESYHRFLEHFAMDWTGVQGVSRSSAALQFLVDSGLMKVPDAIRLVARRRVIAAPGFTWESPEEIETWADRYEEPSAENEKEPGLFAKREDLRGLETYTIDPADAKDFDDAVSLEEHDDGSALLWVHIADVSHYVEKDSRLDHHARERATSVYLPTGVLPMLPRKLSENLCSLRDGVDRLAMGVRLEVDPQGRVTGSRPYEAVIRVDRNVHYRQADDAIEKGEEPFAALNRLAQRMRQARKGLEIESGELRIRFVEEQASEMGRREGVWEGSERDSTEEPSSDVQPGGVDPAVGLSVQIKRASPATRMIEMFMVAANEAVSHFVAENEAGVPYRCHPLPEQAKAERFTAEAKVLGLDVVLELPTLEEGTPDEDAAAQEDEGGDDLLAQLKGGKLQLGGFAASETIGSRSEKEQGEEGQEEEVKESSESSGLPLRGFAQLTPQEQDAYLAPFQKALEKIQAIEDEATRDLAHQKLLSTLGRALYTPKNVGHFGLGSTMYAHFTSPIRRYPDLVLHRQLRWLLRRGTDAGTSDEAPHLEEHLTEFCAHCSGQTQQAERLEWDLLGTCMVFESRREQWSGGLQALVTGITSGGVFLSLPANLEAYLAMRDIPGGPYEVDEHSTMIYRSRFSRGAAEDPAAAESAKLAGLDWRELEDPETGEIREVRLKLGDRVKVQIRERDLVEGKVRVRLAG